MFVVNYLLPFFGMLVALIVIHELGHYFTAKFFNIKVLEAGLGYPPRIWGFNWKGTLYSVNLLPLGGFVRLMGEEDPDDPQSLAAQARWKRIIVLASGSVMNLALPILLFTLVFMLPREVPVGPATVTTVVPNSPAASAGLEPGDVIQEIEGQSVKNSSEAIRITRLHQGQTIEFKVKRPDPTGGDAQILTLYAKSRWDPPPITYTVQPGDTVRSVAEKLGLPENQIRAAADIKQSLEPGTKLTIESPDGPIEYRVRDGDSVETVARRLDVTKAAVREAADLPDPGVLEVGEKLSMSQGPIGIGIGNLYPFTENESYGFFTSVRKGWTATWETLILFRNQILTIFHGGGGPDFAGPVGIAQTTGEVVEDAGWKPLLELAALLSINLGIVNMLPLPMLDGGRIVFVLIEIARRGKRIAPEKEAIVHLVGLALILTMAIVVTYFDVARIIGGGSLFE
ncbi:MAG: site-2 protease family protein [Dehalococcoidia bacterium]